MKLNDSKKVELRIREEIAEEQIQIETLTKVGIPADSYIKRVEWLKKELDSLEVWNEFS